MKQSRRDFFKVASYATAGLAGLKPTKAAAAPVNIVSDDRMGVLVDTTVCIGCRQCEIACKKEHDLPIGSLEDYVERNIMSEMRRPDTTALTVINEYKTEETDNVSDVKVQCMHCDHPACVSACIVGALSKQENGAVIWDSDRCIGCRYCMIACPFQIPAFEYDKAVQPRIMKCDLCYETRTSKGLQPACVEACPQEALIFGKRYDLLKFAHKKIEQKPENYIDHIYGEHEVGGTSWLYLSAVEFNKLDFPQLSEKAAPGATEPLQHALFKYFIPPVSLYAILGGIMWMGKNSNESEEE